MDLSDFSAPLRVRLVAPTVAFLALGVLVSVAKAAPPGPPPEAVAACASAKEGDGCSMTHDGHTMSGTCSKGPDGSLSCRPGPPPEEP